MKRSTNCLLPNRKDKKEVFEERKRQLEDLLKSIKKYEQTKVL